MQGCNLKVRESVTLQVYPRVRRNIILVLFFNLLVNLYGRGEKKNHGQPFSFIQ